MKKDYLSFIENTFKLNPVLIVGSGVSAGAGISNMNRLATYLTTNVQTHSFSDQERQTWEEIKTKLSTNGMGLEEVLQDSGEAISKKLLDEIVFHCWNCISNDERKLLLEISAGADPTGFIRYFDKYQKSTNEIIHIITTNYDHLIEWSASKAGWRIWDGFSEGPISPQLSVHELDERMKHVIKTGRNKWLTTTIQHLRIYKPHGSLSWFKHPDSQVLKMQNIGIEMLPMLKRVNITPSIVTPGTGKYLETHKEPYYSVFSEMRRALEKCRALVILGFGFNDLHIQSSFEPLLRDQSIPKIILAKELSANTESLIESQTIKNYIAIRKVDENSHIISDNFKSFVLDEPNHWTFSELLNQAWGDEEYAGASKSI